MTVTTYPENCPTDRFAGEAFAMIHMRDPEGVIQRLRDLVPRLPYDLFIEVKYLDSALNFSGEYF